MQTSRGAPRERDACRCRLSGVPFVLWNLVSTPDAGTRGRRLVPGILSHNFFSFPSDQRQQIDGRRKVIGVWVVFPVIAFFFFPSQRCKSLYLHFTPAPCVCGLRETMITHSQIFRYKDFSRWRTFVAGKIKCCGGGCAAYGNTRSKGVLPARRHLHSTAGKRSQHWVYARQTKFLCGRTMPLCA